MNTGTHDLDDKALSTKDNFAIDTNTAFIYRPPPDEFPLTRGQYDADYVINLLKTILSKCDQYQLSPDGLRLAIMASCKALIARIETEKYQTSDPKVLVTCNSCGEQIVVPRSMEKTWICSCKGRKLIKHPKEIPCKSNYSAKES